MVTTPDKQLDQPAVVDREDLKARLLTICIEPGDESEAGIAELNRRLAEVCPDEALLRELIEENNRDLMREVGIGR